MNVAALLQDSPSDDHSRRRQQQQEQQRQEQQRQQQQHPQYPQQQHSHHPPLPSPHDRDRPPHEQRLHAPHHRSLPPHRTPPDYPRDAFPPPPDFPQQPAHSHQHAPYGMPRQSPMYLPPPTPHHRQLDYSPPPLHSKPPPPLLHEPSSMYTGLPPLHAPPPSSHHRHGPPPQPFAHPHLHAPMPPHVPRRHADGAPAMASLQPPRDRENPPPPLASLPHHPQPQPQSLSAMARDRDSASIGPGPSTREDGDAIGGSGGGKKKRSRAPVPEGRRPSGNGSGRRSDVEREYEREMREVERGRAREREMREREMREREMHERDMRDREMRERELRERDMRERERDREQRQRDDMEYIRAIAAARKADEGGYMSKSDSEMNASNHYAQPHPYYPPSESSSVPRPPPPPPPPPRHHQSHSQSHTPSHTIFGPTPTAHSHRFLPPPPPIRTPPPIHLGRFVFPDLPFPLPPSLGTRIYTIPATAEKGEEKVRIRDEREVRAIIYVPNGFVPSGKPAAVRVWGGAGGSYGAGAGSLAMSAGAGGMSGRRVYTDDSDVLGCCVHAGLVSWGALRGAKAQGWDVQIEVGCVGTWAWGGQYVGGVGAPVRPGGDHEMLRRDAARRRGDDGREPDEDEGEEDDGRGIYSAGWGNGHDGGGIEILEVSFVEKDTAHKAAGLGRRNRKQRLIEYASARKEALDAGARIVFGDLGTQPRFKYDADGLRGALLDDEDENGRARKKRRLDGKDAIPYRRGLVLETGVEKFLLKEAEPRETDKENEPQEPRWEIWLVGRTHDSLPALLAAETGSPPMSKPPSPAKGKGKASAPVLLQRDLTAASFEFAEDEVRVLGEADGDGSREGWAIEVRGWRWAVGDEGVAG